MDIKSVNPKLRHDQIAKYLGCSSSIFQRYRNVINMLSPYTIPRNSNKRRQKISNQEHDLERPQLTSKYSAPIIESVKPKKNKSKGGGNIEINDE